MNLLLKEEDRRAVDLLLDGSLAMSDSSVGIANRVQLAADPSLGQRVAGAQKVLSLLDLLSHEEPPADLVQSTMHFIDAAVAQGAAYSNLASIPGDRPGI